MSSGWLEIEDGDLKARVELRPGLTRVGSAGSDVSLQGVVRGELHFWDDPPKVVFLGAGEAPLLGGEPLEERELRGGERIVWGRAVIRYEVPAASAAAPAASAGAAAGRLLEEITLPPVVPGAGRLAAPEERTFARLRAGLLVELGLAERRAMQRWQEAVLRGEYEPDACARDLLAGSGVAADDPRVLERSGRLLRDFLMSPLTRGVRGAARRMRGAAKSGTAFVVSQFLVLLVFSTVLLGIMILVRLKWDFSFDGAFDRVLGR